MKIFISIFQNYRLRCESQPVFVYMNKLIDTAIFEEYNYYVYVHRREQ